MKRKPPQGPEASPPAERPPLCEHAGTPGKVSHSVAEPSPELRVHTLTCSECGAAASYDELLVPPRPAA